MASLTCTIEPDELLGLRALLELDRAADAGAVSKAKALMRTALADKLDQAGLPWAPSAEAAGKRAAQAAAAQASALRGITGNGRARKGAAAPAIIAGGLLSAALAPAAHAATLTAGGSNSISAHLTGKGAATYPDAVFGNVKVNETSHAKFDTVGATFTDGPRLDLAGQTGSVGWNSDFTNSGHQTGVLTYTVNADGTGYSGQATYPNG